MTDLNNKVTEDELKARSQFPRVTLEALEANIASHSFDYHDLLVKCTIVLKNSFMVTGESACAVPGNYKKDVGERLAYNDAKNKIWALMGYELKTKVAMAMAARPATISDAKTYVGTKVIHARPMTRGVYNQTRGWNIPADENPEDEGYYVEYANDGYISWSPKDVFEASYEEMNIHGEGAEGGPTWKDRLEVEIADLTDRQRKLCECVDGPLFLKFPTNQQELLKQQLQHMTAYLSILHARMDG